MQTNYWCWIVSVIEQVLEPFNCVQIKLLVLNTNSWKHLTMCKQIMLLTTIHLQIIYV